MKIIFDIVTDRITGLEWRQLLITNDAPPKILSKSWRRFTHFDQIFAEIKEMSLALNVPLEVMNGKYIPPKPNSEPLPLEPIHPIAHPREIPVRKDLE